MHANPPQSGAQATQVVDSASAACACATRHSRTRGLETSPRALVFNRDESVDAPLVASLQVMNERKQQLVGSALMKGNAKRIQQIEIADSARGTGSKKIDLWKGYGLQ